MRAFGWTVVLFHMARALPFQSSDQTNVTKSLNDAIQVGSCYGCYDGGKGVLVRNPFDDYENRTDLRVVPATFLVNDIVVPTSVYPTGWNGWLKGNGNPDCPNGGTNGYYPLSKCYTDTRTQESGPWSYATTAYVIHTELKQVFDDFDNIQMEDWAGSVFYPTDANSVNGRCFWSQQFKGYDCPGGWIPWSGKFEKDDAKKGASAYPPGLGWGGAGCHVNLRDSAIDQTTVDTATGKAGDWLADQSCQCNYKFKRSWDKWVATWISQGMNYNSLDGWFRNGTKKGPGHALDQGACWLNNPRDLINLQNHIYLQKFRWNNQLAPKSSWDTTKPGSLRVYWGWNEVPISREAARNEQLRDAVMIKLPAAIDGGMGGTDSLWHLGRGQGENLEGDLNLWVKNGILKLGAKNVARRPGSQVVLLREWMHSIPGWSNSDTWSRYFFCENWTSPNGKYKIVFVPVSSTNEGGACYVDEGSALHTFQTLRNQMLVV